MNDLNYPDDCNACPRCGNPVMVGLDCNCKVEKPMNKSTPLNKSEENTEKIVLDRVFNELERYLQKNICEHYGENYTWIISKKKFTQIKKELYSTIQTDNKTLKEFEEYCKHLYKLASKECRLRKNGCKEADFMLDVLKVINNYDHQ